MSAVSRVCSGNILASLGHEFGVVIILSIYPFILRFVGFILRVLNGYAYTPPTMLTGWAPPRSHGHTAIKYRGITGSRAISRKKGGDLLLRTEGFPICKMQRTATAVCEESCGGAAFKRSHPAERCGRQNYDRISSLYSCGSIPRPAQKHFQGCPAGGEAS